MCTTSKEIGVAKEVDSDFDSVDNRPPSLMMIAPSFSVASTDKVSREEKTKTYRFTLLTLQCVCLVYPIGMNIMNERQAQKRIRTTEPF